jgi:hypothetical protein
MPNRLLFFPKKKDALEITTAVPVDDQFSSPKQIRWSAALGKLLVGDYTNNRGLVRNFDLSFYSKFNAPRVATAMDADLINIYSTGGLGYNQNIYKHSFDPSAASFISTVALGIGNLRMIDASGDPDHVYVTSNNATDGHGVRMVTKSSMLVTGGGSPVQILSTGTTDGKFTNPLGVLYIATNADAGFLYVCEATRICKIAVVTTSGSESLTWTTSYAIAANDLAWDGINFYVQTTTTLYKYDSVFTDATKTSIATNGYSCTYIPDQGDGNGATIAVCSNANSNLERHKCSDLSLINTVGSSGDGSSSLYDPTFTTSIDTYIDWVADDGQSGTMTRTGSGPYTHAHSLNGFAAIFFKTAGPHVVKYKVRAGLGAVTVFGSDTDALTAIRNLGKLINITSITLNTNPALIESLGNVRNRANLQTLKINGTLFSGIGDISDMLAIRDVRFADLSLNLATVNTVIDSIWSSRMSYTYLTGSNLTIGGTGGTANASPTGTYVAPSEGTDWHEDVVSPAHWIPLTQKAKIYDLVVNVNTETRDVWTITYAA